MGYKLKQGIVYLKICGADILVPCSSVWDETDQIKLLTKQQAGLLNLLLKDCSIDVMYNLYSVFMKNADTSEIQNKVMNDISQLIDSGYLIEN